MLLYNSKDEPISIEDIINDVSGTISETIASTAWDYVKTKYVSPNSRDTKIYESIAQNKDYHAYFIVKGVPISINDFINNW